MSGDNNARTIFRLHVNENSYQCLESCVSAIPGAKNFKNTYQLFHDRNDIIGRTATHHRRIKDGAPFERWSDEWADFAI